MKVAGFPRREKSGAQTLTVKKSLRLTKESLVSLQRSLTLPARACLQELKLFLKASRQKALFVADDWKVPTLRRDRCWDVHLHRSNV